MMNDFQNLMARRNAYLTIPEAAEFLRVSQRTL